MKYCKVLFFLQMMIRLVLMFADGVRRPVKSVVGKNKGEYEMNGRNANMTVAHEKDLSSLRRNFT